MLLLLLRLLLLLLLLLWLPLLRLPLLRLLPVWTDVQTPHLCACVRILAYRYPIFGVRTPEDFLKDAERKELADEADPEELVRITATPQWVDSPRHRPVR